MKKKWKNSGLLCCTRTNQGRTIAPNTHSPGAQCRRRRSAQSRSMATYTRSATAGSTIPISPLLSTAQAIAAHARIIQPRSARTERSARRLNRKLSSAAVRKKVSPMSRVRNWPPRKYPQQPATVSAVTIQGEPGARRSPANAASRIPRKPVRAGHRRAVHSSAPNSANAPAVAQYCSGGFSRYLISLSRGVTQSFESSIPRAISAYRPSSGSNSARYSIPANHIRAQRRKAWTTHRDRKKAAMVIEEKFSYSGRADKRFLKSRHEGAER